jgi:hypothetical protein
MPISAHFIFRSFWDFSRKRQKSAIFLAKNPLFSLTYLKNEKIYIVIEDKKRVFGHSEFLPISTLQKSAK